MKKIEEFEGVYNYIDKIIEKCTQERKKIIVWGIGIGGRFAKHLIEELYDGYSIDIFIDEKANIAFCDNMYRSSILGYIDCKDYIIINTTANGSDVWSKCSEYGFEKGITFFDMREDIGQSYIDYIQKKYDMVDFSSITAKDRPDLYEAWINNESTPFQHSSIVKVFDEIDQLQVEKNFFDYGCGKGQIIMMAYYRGMKKVGGIDLNKDCVNAAETNMKVLGIEAQIICDDALKYEDVDDYNVFFMYNPFHAKIMIPVLHNIEKSFARKNRDIYIIYGNPFYHKDVVNNTHFKLYKQVRVDLYDPLLNIYKLDL